MHTIHVEIDKAACEAANRYAKARGVTLEQLLREYVEQLAHQGTPKIDYRKLEETFELCSKPLGTCGATRDELHER